MSSKILAKMMGRRILPVLAPMFLLPALLLAVLRGFPRQPNGKLTSLPDSGTRRSHTSPVQLHKVAHQCETDAEPRFGARSRFIRLPEQIEYVR